MSRARNGDGSIKPRKTKTKGTVWDVQVSVRLPNGMTDRVTKRGFASEKAAIKWRNDVLRKAELGKLAATKPITVPQVVRAYLDAHPRMRGSSKKSFEDNLKNHISKRLNVRVDSLTSTVMEKYYNGTVEVMTRGRNGSGVNGMTRSLVNAALNWASHPDVGMLMTNPLRGTRVSEPTKNAKRKDIPLGDVKALLEATEGLLSGIMWRLMLETGARKGEIVALQWADIDFQEGTVEIRKIATPESGYKEIIWTTKGKKHRTVPLSSSVRAILAKRKLEVGGGEMDYIFPSRDGFTPIGKTTIYGWWTRDTKAAGIVGRKAHELRHTWATMALDSGMDVKVVSEILGHSSVSITLEVYRHVTATDKRAAVDAVSRRIEG